MRDRKIKANSLEFVAQKQRRKPLVAMLSDNILGKLG